LATPLGVVFWRFEFQCGIWNSLPRPWIPSSWRTHSIAVVTNYDFAGFVLKCPGRLPRRSFAKAGVATQTVANAAFFDIEL